MTMTIDETANQLATRLDIPTPDGESLAEFRLSFARTQRIDALKTELLRLATSSKLRARYPDGGYLPRDSMISESSQVDIAEAQAALEVMGWKFAAEESAAFSGTPESEFHQEKQVDLGVDRNKTEPPGNLPKVACGKLAVFAAWEIEGEKKRAATRGEVMELLQTWADDGSHPETLMKSVKRERAVEWKTKSGKPKIYDIEACAKTLETWLKSRA